MSPSAQPFSAAMLIDMLIADPERLQTTKYAEIGIPMFLIGEEPAHGSWHDLLASGTDYLGRHFIELAASLAHRKPALDVYDVFKLLEILAEQDFFPPIGAASTQTAVKALAGLSLPAQAPPVLTELAAGLASSHTIRLINYHATPRYREAEFRQQIAAAAQAFEPITQANFAAAVAGRWPHERPGLMPALFEGYRDNLDVMLPILEEFGFTAWFFLPSEFLAVPADEQRSYALAHNLDLPEHDEYADARIAMTWDEARDIARRGHAFACHTRTHNSVSPETPGAVLKNEIIIAKREIEAELGAGVTMFCWLGGAALGVNPQADAMLREAGFLYLFSNFKIQQL